MLLTGAKLKVKKPFQGFKKDDVLTIEEIYALELKRNDEHMGSCIKFKEHDKEFPISIFEDGYVVETKKLTTEQILNWFK